MMNDSQRIEYLETCLLETAKCIAQGVAGKIHAIKAYRTATGMSLLESKNWVESFESNSTDRFHAIEIRLTALERWRAQP
jgi:ribosomal protein L7/L12